uniref:Uncharacterized protein n=1 Tax=uncultured Thiotrichaceae bacterium TaxID=298394 RepID=A0A6S6UG35_9GAMM|nr:MAG: Unknown protein [uncultured Thiotrichaceae bacterium]
MHARSSLRDYDTERCAYFRRDGVVAVRIPANPSKLQA